MAQNIEYSFEDIRKHNDRNSTWIVINDDIYDVTDFLNEHPGGEEVLLEQAGKDASENFEDVGHSSDARELMVKYKIGTLVASERKPEIRKKADPASWGENTDSSQSSFKSWILPIALGLLATVVYRVYFMS
ncbi:cytochrome b5 isoform X1 [Cylas formicarius]|uniref:cytochrome b5 isoform X1 n=1 Tax=Cylas formicarius TaxID=197179 RepID=UPI0029584821|nr:cytochrome b5 isoform X1 [Cylas formicarius]